MPNRSGHHFISLIVVLIASFIFGISFFEEYPIHVIFFFIGGIAPDLMEPALSYKHRRFFHSKLFLVILSAIVIFIIYLLFNNSTEELIILAGAFILGIIVHLLADATTKMGLPRW